MQAVTETTQVEQGDYVKLFVNGKAVGYYSEFKGRFYVRHYSRHNGCFVATAELAQKKLAAIESRIQESFGIL